VGWYHQSGYHDGGLPREPDHLHQQSLHAPVLPARWRRSRADCQRGRRSRSQRLYPDLSNAIAAGGQFINRRFYTPSWGVGASGTWFKDHLYTMVGFRRDHFNMRTIRGSVRPQQEWVVDYQEASNTASLQFVQYKVDGANYGGVLRLNEMFALGYNYAQSFRLSVGQGAQTFREGEVLGIPVGEGTDVSARFSFLKGKLELNIVAIRISRPTAASRSLPPTFRRRWTRR
jgi:hypothetical protein